MKNKTYNRKKILVVFSCAVAVILGLVGRLVYLMVFEAEYYQKKAEALHEREREIKAARGEIVDAKGTVLATNKTVCTISVIHSQIKEPEKIIRALSRAARNTERLKEEGTQDKDEENHREETGRVFQPFRTVCRGLNNRISCGNDRLLPSAQGFGIIAVKLSQFVLGDGTAFRSPNKNIQYPKNAREDGQEKKD